MSTSVFRGYLQKVSVCLVFVLLFSLTLCLTVSSGKAFARSDDSYGFSDVSSDDWYATYDVLGYVTDYGLLNGYSDGRFAPWDNISRGQVATILWRMAGQPVATSQKFSDVDYSLYYGDAISWARSAGVISGYKDANGNVTGFGPDDPVTREQFAVMLANYTSYIGFSTSSDLSKLNSMPDANSVSSWAIDSVGWAMECGIITGDKTYDPARIVPQGYTQRAAAAKMIAVLHRDVLRAGSDNSNGNDQDYGDSADYPDFPGGERVTYEDGSNGITPQYVNAGWRIGSCSLDSGCYMPQFKFNVGSDAVLRVTLWSGGNEYVYYLNNCEIEYVPREYDTAFQIEVLYGRILLRDIYYPAQYLEGAANCYLIEDVETYSSFPTDLDFVTSIY